MTKEQEEAIKEIKTYIHDYTMEAFDDDGYTRYEISEEEQNFFNNIDKLLNMLKENSAEIQQKNTEIVEKNAQIEKYKNLLASNLAKNLNDSIKAKEKADTDLDDLDKGWKVELEKKDKMIDLTLEFLAERDLGYYQKEEGGEIQGIFRKYNKDDWKQYFERKEENV